LTITVLAFNSNFNMLDMTNNVPLYVIGLPKDEPAGALLKSKFGYTLNKVQQILSHIIEAKIAVESQNPEGTRTHYDVTATIKTSKKQLIYTNSGWDILKIADELCRKLEGELPKHDTNRQKESVRKRMD